MPLLGKASHELSKTKPKPNREYFVIRFTNEHFKKYSDYLDQLDKYRLRQWTCSITNKTNLTFEEALLSEKKAIDKVSKFSEVLLPHCLRLIQYKDSNLDELRDSIYDYFNNNYFSQEMITFKAEGTKYTGKVVSLAQTSSNPSTSSSSSSASSDDSDTDRKPTSSTTTTEANGTSYTAPASSKTSAKKSKLSDSEGSSSSESDDSDSSDSDERTSKKYIVHIEEKNKTLTVSIKDIIRRIPPIYKPMIKDTIRLVAKKTKQGYWLVEDSLVHKYDIDVPIPSHLKNEPNLKRKSDDSRGGRNNDDNGSSSDEETKKRRKPLYPIEDNDIDRTQDDEEKPTCPIPSCNFISSSEMYGDLLMVWHFLSQFEKVLQLSPFSLEDFESALQHPSETTLLVETHIRLLKLVFGLSIYSHGTPKKHFSIKMLTDRNWLTLLKVYFSYESKRLELEEKKKADRKKQLAEQNDKMMCLASDIPDDEDDNVGDEEDLKKKEQDFGERLDKSKTAMEEDEDIEMAEDEDEEVAHDDDGEAILQEDDDTNQEPSNFITTNHPENIIRVLKKRNYFRLRVDEKLHILSYLVMQAIQSDRIRRHLDEITEAAGEIRQEKRELVLEERKIKKEEEDNAAATKKEGKKSGKVLELGKIQKKEENLDQQLVKYSSRLEPLGQDRDYHKYWYWQQLLGRIYIEHTKGDWAYYTSRQELDDLVQYLDNRGVRERKLLSAIKQKYETIASAIELKTQKITTQLAIESKRSARIKAIYGDRTYVGYVNKYNS